MIPSGRETRVSCLRERSSFSFMGEKIGGTGSRGGKLGEKGPFLLSGERPISRLEEGFRTARWRPNSMGEESRGGRGKRPRALLEIVSALFLKKNKGYTKGEESRLTKGKGRRGSL